MRVRFSSAVSAVALSCVAVPASAADPSLAADAKAFGTRDAAFSVDLSPSGKRLALLVPGPGKITVLRVIDLSTVAVTNVIKTEGNPDSLQWCSFASDDQLICQFGGNVLSGGDSVVGFTRLMEISADGKTIRQLGQKDHTDSALRQYDGTVLDWLPDEQGSVLMARVYVPELGETGNYNRDTREGLGVDRVDLANLKITHVEPPRPAAANYLTDGRGNVRLMETDDTDHEGLLTGAESPENMSRSLRCRRRLRLKWIPTWSASITAATQISLRTVPSSRRKTTIPATRKPIEITAATATGVQPAKSSGKNAVR